MAIFNGDKNSIFKGLLWTNLSEFQTVYEILNINLVIQVFEGNLAFYHFSGFGLFETPYGQIWPLKFFEPSNPDFIVPKKAK